MSARQLFQNVISTLLVGFSSVSCSLAPGLYVDNLPLEDSNQQATQQLGEPLTVIPVTAALVQRLRDEHLHLMEDRRRRSHELFLDNQAPRLPSEYLIGKTDILSIVAWGHPELNIVASASQPGAVPTDLDVLSTESSAPAEATGHEVDLNGNIFYPYIGLTPVAGKTLAEVRTLITTKLAQYIPNPQIDVGVSGFRSQRAYVVGQVNTPRALPITQVPIEIVDAITQVSGLTAQADTRNVTLIRNRKKYPIDLQAILDGDLTQNYVLQHGDILAIPDNRYNSVFIFGELLNTVKVITPPTAFFSLADAINDQTVSGFTPEANPGTILVFRYPDNADLDNAISRPNVYHLNASSAEAMLLATGFPLKARDIVYVAPKDVSRWNRVVERILPTVQSLYLPVRTLESFDGISYF